MNLEKNVSEIGFLRIEPGAISSRACTSFLDHQKYNRNSSQSKSQNAACVIECLLFHCYCGPFAWPLPAPAATRLSVYFLCLLHFY